MGGENARIHACVWDPPRGREEHLVHADLRPELFYRVARAPAVPKRLSAAEIRDGRGGIILELRDD